MSNNQQQQRRRPYNDEQKQNISQTKRRRQAAISLASFSSKKGHDRALKEFKKRKETKFHENATLLRGYKKAMKQGGYDAGRGASRKRENHDEDDDASQTNDKKDELETADTKPHKKRHKSDPLHHARKVAEQRKAEQLEAISQQADRKQNEGKKVQNRKVRARKMMKRTKRGQPLMKNVIGDLLGKIKSEVGDGGEEA